MSKVLITGGAGFIGSHIAERLVREGHEVVILDDLRSGNRENISAFRDKVTLHEGSVLDGDVLKEVMTGCEYVIHEAAIPSVSESVHNPLGTHEVNVTGMLRVLEVARTLGVKRVVYASSCAVYGDSPTLPKVETMERNPLSPYALHKSLCEDYARLYTSLYGLEVVGLRYFNVYGPRQDHRSEYSGVISKFISETLKGNPVTIYGDGKNTRDFIYVGDVATAHVASLTLGVPGAVYNIARGESVSLLELRSTIAELVGTDIPAYFGAPREGDIKYSSADTARAAESLEFTARTTLHDGLKETIEFYKQHAG